MKKYILLSAILFSTLVFFGQISAVKTSIYSYDFITNVNGKLLFFANNEINPNDYELWGSDGTEAGTQLVMDINPGPEGSALDNSLWGAQYQDRSPVVFNNEIYFLAYEPMHGVEIWKSDGTTSGTVMLKDIYPGVNGFFTPEFNYPYFTEMGGELFFAANDGIHGFELWKTDGTEAGTEMVKDISADNVYGSNPEHLINYNGTLVFTARDDVYGYEIFKSDGTNAGTQIIKDIVTGIDGSMNNGYASSIDPQFTVVGDNLFFTARIDAALPVSYKLFRTDGTNAGTIALNTTLKDIAGFSDLGGNCYFYAFDGDYEHSGFWKSDGSVAGTELINTNNELKALFNYTSVFSKNGSLYFYGTQDGYTKYGLFKSDGTTAGTKMIYQLEGLGSAPEVANFNSVDGNNIFFCRALLKVSDFAMSYREMQSNGTTETTIIHGGAVPNRSSAFLEDNLYFLGMDTTAEENRGLFKLEPTEIPEAISDIDLQHLHLNIFPNPTSNSIYLEIPDIINNAIIEIYNTLGEKVFSTTILSSSKQNLNLTQLDNGLYFVSLFSDQKVFSGSFTMVHE